MIHIRDILFITNYYSADIKNFMDLPIKSQAIFRSYHKSDESEYSENSEYSDSCK